MSENYWWVPYVVKTATIIQFIIFISIFKFLYFQINLWFISTDFCRKNNNELARSFWREQLQKMTEARYIMKTGMC